jgi:hypothetical protein
MLLVVGCASAPNSMHSYSVGNELRAQAVTATYYVNNKSGSNCSNTGAGTSQAQPWCDFVPVNAKTFQPGDQVLLARGETWNQGVTLHGSGTAADVITLGAYGSGNRPIVRRNGASADVAIDLVGDPNNWVISDLEVNNAENGIRALYASLGNSGLQFSRLYVHHVSNGIAFGGTQTATRPNASQWILRNVTVAETEVSFAKYGILAYTQLSGYSDYPVNSIQDIVIKGNYTHDISLVTLPLITVTRSNIFDNYLDYVGKIAEPQGTTGVYLWRCDDLTFSNNVLVNMPNTNSVDQSAVDFEAYTTGIKMRGNFIADNAGPGLEFLALSGRTGDYNNNHEASSNTFVRNGAAGSSQFKSSLYWDNSTGISLTGVARDNIYFEPTGFASGTPSGWSATNNLSSNAASDLYHAGYQFGTSQGTNQWSYQSTAGGGYSNLAFDGVNYRWGTANRQIRQFSMLPDVSGWVARAWTAPKAGSISLRGRVLKSDASSGDGVLARITKNEVMIWPTTGNAQVIAFNDQTGTDSNLDDVTVAAGDVIRFEVSSGGAGNVAGDLTSWSPAVGYTVGGGTVSTNLALGKTYASSSNWDSTQTAEKAFDGLSNTNWQSAPGSGFNGQTLEVNFGANTTFGKAIVTEYGNRTQGYRIEYWNGSSWLTAFTGTTIGDTGVAKTVTFSPVTGSKARIYFTAGTHTPIIFEFGLYSATGGGSDGVNFALNQTMVSSSNWAGGSSYNAAKANDNDTTTGWSPEGPSTDPRPWLWLDLGQPRTLSRIELVTRQDIDQSFSRRDFQIMASNNGDFSQPGAVVLGSVGSTPLAFQSTFTVNVTDTTAYRYVAVVKSADGYVFVSELRVF